MNSFAFDKDGNLKVKFTGDFNVTTTGQVQDTLYIDFAAGETQVSHPLLEQTGVVILFVARETALFKPTTGTPGNQQWKFTGGAGNGTVEFDPTNPSLGETIIVSYKIVLA